MPSRSTLFLDLISGRRKGLHYDVARGCLSLVSVLYRAVIGVRNAYYSLLPFSRHKVGCPVISIGNITVGGTGKTPVAARISLMLLERGRRVAILTRGYKGKRRNVKTSKRRNVKTSKRQNVKTGRRHS